MPERLPDARFVITLATEGDDLDKGLDQLNPILKEILIGRMRPTVGPLMLAEKFGRLTFSQTG
jgi:hypothetical protein